jgi:O-antigen/teichoic acid export membrane protein
MNKSDFKSIFKIFYSRKSKMILNNFKKLISKGFIKSVFTVASGTAIAQIITMLFSPVLTRIYGPEAFGILGVFNSIVAITTPIAALTYPIGIVLPADDSDAIGLIRLSVYISTAMSILVGVIFVVFGKTILKLFRIDTIHSYLILIPVIMLFSAGLQVSQQWCIRKKQFKIKAKVAIIQSLVLNILQSGFGFVNPSSAILIITTTLGKGIHAFMLIWESNALFRKNKLHHLERFDNTKASLWKLAKAYRDFPMYRAPEVFINAISQTLPVLALTTFFGPVAAGFYSIGKKVLEMPSQLIGNSVGDVFYPRISEASHNKEDIKKILKKATLSLAAIGIFPFGVIILFGPSLFNFVFGSDWLMAGEYARWIAVWSYFGFMNIPSIKTLPVIGEQKFHLHFSIVTIITRLIALTIGGYMLKNDVIAVALYSITGAILNSMLILITISKSGSYICEG